MRPFAFAALLALAACVGPRETTPYPEDAGPPSGGLTDALAVDLSALGVPVLVPSDPGAFELTDVQVSERGTAARWALDYRRADGVCFELSGGSETAATPAFPLVSASARIDRLGQTVRVYQAADVLEATSAQVWGLNTVVSDVIRLNSASALFLSDTNDGCQPVSLEEGVRLVSSLERLAFAVRAAGPAPSEPMSSETDSARLGAFAPADDVLEDYNAASTPEAAADALARRYADDAGRVTVDVLSETAYEAIALVTLLDLRDDSVRDERLRLTYTPVGPVWELVQAGRQVRCQPGRGHADWSDAACQ